MELEDQFGNRGGCLQKTIMDQAGEALKDNLETVAPRFLPYSEQGKVCMHVALSSLCLGRSVSFACSLLMRGERKEGGREEDDGWLRLVKRSEIRLISLSPVSVPSSFHPFLHSCLPSGEQDKESHASSVHNFEGQ